MKIVYLIKNIKKIENIHNSEHIIYSFDDQTSKILTEKSLEYKEIKDSLSITEIKTIESLVMEIVTKWYDSKEIKKYLMINEINLGFLVEWELFPFLSDVIKNIKILEKIIQYEKPDKIIGIGDITNLEYIVKKYNLEYEIKNNQNNNTLFIMDRINVRFDVFNHSIGITLPYEKYISLREKVEKIINIILKIIQSRTKSDQNFLLLEFNASIFSEFIYSAKKLDCKLDFLNLRRPAIWNIRSFKILKNSNSDIIIARDFLKNKEIINEQIKKFTDNLEALFKNEKILKSIFSVNDESYWDIIKSHVQIFLHARGIQAIKEINIANNLFNLNNFKVVIGLNDALQIEKTILSVANQRGIPTIILQHGIFDNRFSKDSPYIRINAVLPLVAKYFAVWGEIVYNYAINQRWDQKNIVITGSPKFDELFKKSKSTKKTKRILLATSYGLPYDYESFRRYRESIKNICRIIHDLKNYELVIKVHPYEQDFIMISEEVKRINPSIRIMINADLDELIESSDVVITYNQSTVILHSLIAQKPTIAIQIISHDIPDKEIFKYNGIVLTQFDNVEVELKKILDNFEYCRKLKENGMNLIDNYFSNQGNASEELLKFMKQLS